MKNVIAPSLKILCLISLLSVVTLPVFSEDKIPNPKKTWFFAMSGQFISTCSFDGSIDDWYFYDDGTFDARWISKKGIIKLTLHGLHTGREKISGSKKTNYLIFSATGKIVDGNGVLVDYTLVGNGEDDGTKMIGAYTLQVGGDDDNSDFGTWKATRSKRRVLE